MLDLITILILLVVLVSLHTAMSTMLVLFYLFCDGKTEDNLSHMFNMFDMDGNKVEYFGFV